MSPMPPRLPAYSAHATFVGRAGNAIEIWRTALGTILFISAFVFLPTLFAGLFLPPGLADAFFQGQTATGVILQFGATILPLLALRAILTGLHRRGLWSLVGDPGQSVIWGLAATKIAVLVLLAEYLSPPWPGQDEIATIRPILPWLLRLPLVLIVVAVQVTGEEMFFRGYLQQQIAARTRNPIIWMGVPSLLFGAAHYLNADGPLEGALWVFWAVGLGLACADLTARSGSLGPAIGLHLVNNMFALTVFGMENGPVSGLALFLTPYGDPAGIDQSLSLLGTLGGIFQILMLGLQIVILWLAGRLAIRR